MSEGNVLLVHLKGWRADELVYPPEFLYGNTLRGSQRNVKMYSLKVTTGSHLVHLSAFCRIFHASHEKYGSKP